MATIERRRLDAQRAERWALMKKPSYSEVIYEDLRIPVVSTARPAHDGVSAHNPKNMGGVRMVIVSLPRVSFLEQDDDNP